MSTITISQYTCNPSQELSPDDTLEVRSFYTRSFIGSDGITPIFGNNSNGAFGPYYSITPTLNLVGDLVVPAHDVQPTTESSPTGNYIEQLWVNGAFSQTLMPNTGTGSGWQIPTVYGDPIAYDEIATYNRAKRLLYAPATYFTADQTIQEIERLAGNFDFMAVGVNGVGSASFPPVVASLPIVLMENDPKVGDWVNIKAYFADTTATAAQNAVFIAAAVAAATSSGRGIFIPAGTFATNSVTISVPVMFAEGASILSPATAQMVTITKSIEANPQQHFGGLGTISFSGNTSLKGAWWHWWGALPTATGAINSAAFNAANAALVTIGAGEIWLGDGTFSVNSLLTVGSDSVTFTSVGVGGEGWLKTKLSWTGSTSGTVMYVTNGVGNDLHDFQLSNAVAAGTTVGLRISGPGIGTNSTGITPTRIDINGFNVGHLIGDGTSGGHDASEITYTACTFQANNTGVRADGSNTLNLNFYGCGFDANLTQGLEIANGGAVHLFGGAWGRNPIGIKVMSGVVSLLVLGIRDEGIAGSKFISSTAASITAQITVQSCEFQQVDSTPCIQGLGAFTLIGNDFGSISSAVYPFLGNSGGGNGGSLTMIGNTVNEAAEIFSIDGNSAGMIYTLLNNIKLNGSGANGHWDNEYGVVDPTGPSKRAYFKANQGGVLTADILTFTALDTTPSVKFTTRFKTNNAFATSVTTFDDGVSGQIINVIVSDTHTTFVNGATLATRTGSNIVASNGLTYSFLLDSTVWRQL